MGAANMRPELGSTGNHAEMRRRSEKRKAYAAVLGVLAFAFLLRVVGQLLVACCEVDFLPPMAEWYSGLLPYPVLLPIQVLILSLQVKVSADIWRGVGFFAARRMRAGKVLCWLSYVYATGMALRYALSMSAHPERRWLHGTIPIFFHVVLAAYLFVLGFAFVRMDSAKNRQSGDEHDGT
jgi:hypothetical protein